jgi:hypothetical protein
MKNKKNLNIVIRSAFILGVLLFGKSDIAFACTPIYSTPQETFNKADAVFLGRVLSVSTTGTPGDKWDVSGEVKVEKYWKGNVSGVVKIKSSGIYTCGTAFGENAKGGDYLIYATKSTQEPNIYTIGMMDMKLASSFSTEIQTLGAGSTPTSEIAASQFVRNLTLGNSGEDVVNLQTWLEQKGFLIMPAGVSKGYFGGLTRAALAKYQTSVGITPSLGYFGPITRARINSGN